MEQTLGKRRKETQAKRQKNREEGSWRGEMKRKIEGKTPRLGKDIERSDVGIEKI